MHVRPVLVAPNWETLSALTVAVILNRIGRSDWRVDSSMTRVRA